jgi:pimeloyl-ACP methyl ester carboxylesterase
MSARRWVLPAMLTMIVTSSVAGIIHGCAFHPDRRDIPATDQLPAGIKEIYISTEDGERLQCYWLARPPSRWVLIYFMSNTGNIAQRIPDLMHLADLGLNVLGAGYRGFGKSTGRPSERGIYLDGRTELYAMLQRGFKKAQVILMGRSLGSAVAVEIAQDQAIGGLILVAPLTSGKAMALAHGFGPLAYFIGDAYDNLDRISHIRCPLLIVHGTEDEGAPMDMGRQLYAAAPAPKRFVAIRGAHHSDISRFAPDQYWGAIRDFIAGLHEGSIISGGAHSAHRKP